MKSLLLVLVFIGASVAYKVDMSYYHPAVLDFILKKAERLLEGLDGHGGKNDPDHHPFIDQCEQKLGQCIVNAADEACNRVVCSVEFGRCIKNGMPSDPSYTPPANLEPCLEKSKKCYHSTSDCKRKLECAVCLKFCVNEDPKPPAYCTAA